MIIYQAQLLAYAVSIPHMPVNNQTATCYYVGCQNNSRIPKHNTLNESTEHCI